MIRIYSQYSYGGYKTLYIKGEENEPLNADSEVTLVKSHDMPKDAHVFFQFGGCKLIYKRLSNGELDLVVREIPSDDGDGSRRPIPCAVQFIGQEEDRQTLDNMALVIANDLTAFSTFFSRLFFERQGLNIEGDKLRAYINQWKGKAVAIGESSPVLLSIGRRHDGVFLFVPLSEKFGSDREVTSNVCDELKLNVSELKGCVVKLSELNRLQKKLKIVVQTEEPLAAVASEPQGKPAESKDRQADKDARIAELEKELGALKEQIETRKQKENEAFESLQEMQRSLTRKTDESQQLASQLGLYKKIAYGLAALSLVLAIVAISSSSSKKKTDKEKPRTEVVNTGNHQLTLNE